MRKFIDIVEASATPGTVRLYRGDSSQIDRFDTSKTSLFSLFGHGIYLTDNKRVANDYRTKGSDGGVLMRFSGMKTKKQVIDRYIEILAKHIDETGADRSGDIRYWGSAVPFSDGGDWQVVLNDLRKREREMRMEFARQKWAEMSKTYEVRMKLDNTAVIQKKQTGALAEFDVPEEMIRGCLDCEAPITDEVLGLLEYYLKRNGDHATARDMINYVNHQRKWEDEEVSFRLVYTSLTIDAPIRGDWEVQQEFCDELQERGYTGLVYAGGLSMGGGYSHRAYVFWDAEAINACRVA